MIRRAQYDLTADCKLACEFCYADAGVHDGGKSLKVEEVINDIKLKKPMQACLGGGEPFLYPDLERLIKDIVDNSTKVMLSTSAASVPEWFFKLDENYKTNVDVQVSLHASNRQLYLEITGKDSFEDVLSNIHKFVDSGFNTVANSCIYRKNVSDILGIISLCKAIPLHLNIGLVMPVGRGKNVQRLTPGETKELGFRLLPYVASGEVTSELPKMAMLGRTHCYALASAYSLIHSGTCPAMQGISAYTAFGRELPCVFLRDYQQFQAEVKCNAN